MALTSIAIAFGALLGIAAGSWMGRTMSISAAYACCAMLAWLLLPTGVAAESLSHSVLVLDQSSAGLPFNTALASALRSTLNAESSQPISFYSENLDANRFFGSQYEEDYVRFLNAKYGDRPISVIIVVGVSTLDFIERNRERIWPSAPVVFAAIDEATITRRLLPQNVTGTTMQLTLQDMVKVARMVVPDLDAVAIVGDPLERQTFYRHFKEEMPSVANQLKIIDLMNLPVPELKKQVSSLSERTAVLYTGIYYTSEGISYFPGELVSQIAEWANRPLVINVSSYLNKGAIGGYIVQAEPIGQQAARLALRILNGESASDISVTKVASPLIFEWSALRRWGISDNTLPPGSEVWFHIPSLWEQYRWHIAALLTALLVQTCLIWLVFEHRRRNLAEVRSRNSMAELTYMNRRVTAGELSASIAHEVNQPLAGIAGRASAALRWLRAGKPDLKKAEDSLEQILAASHRASDVVASVRAMFKRDTGQRSLVDINSLIRTVLAILRVDLQKNGIEIETRLDERIPAIEGDMVQLQQVILNIVMNASEAMQSVQPRRLKVQSDQSKSGTIRVLVQDTGTGIDAPNIARIFDALFTTKSGGMGMGLSICRSIVEGHGGRIWVSPAPIRGAIFQFELPTTLDKERVSTSAA
jgi:signal transduction histidine kinase